MLGWDAATCQAAKLADPEAMLVASESADTARGGATPTQEMAVTSVTTAASLGFMWSSVSTVRSARGGCTGSVVLARYESRGSADGSNSADRRN
jgi:hypothetical protein